MRRQHPDRRSGDRQVRDPLRPLRGRASARAQRPGVRRGGRLLVHRPRQDARARQRPRRRLLREGRRLADQGSDLPARAARTASASRRTRRRSTWSRRPPRAAGRSSSPAPGQIESANGPYRGEKGTVIAGLGGYQMFDSLAVDGEGHVCVATLITGAVSDIWPDGSRVDQYTLPDMMVTNVCFGGQGPAHRLRDALDGRHAGVLRVAAAGPAAAPPEPTDALRVWLPNCRHLATPEMIRRAAVRAEALGYDSVWVSDHVVVPRANVANFGTTIFDPLITLAVVAGATSRVRLGTTVLIVPYRQAVVTAKMVSSLDALSGGRVILGRRRGLGGGGERHARRAVRGARPDDRRVPARDAGAVDEPVAVVLRQVRAVPRPALRAQAGAEAAPADLGGRTRQGLPAPRGRAGRGVAPDQPLARRAARRAWRSWRA